MEFLSPRFSGRGYVFSVFHDYRSIEYLEDKVKEKAGRWLNGGVCEGERATDRTRVYDQGVGEPFGMVSQHKSSCALFCFDSLLHQLIPSESIRQYQVYDP